MHILKTIKQLLCCNKKVTQIDNTDYTKADAFVKTWSIVEFAKKHGKMQLCQAPDKNNRESYLKCRFIKSDGTITYVTVSGRMQSITVKEISENKDRIKIGMLPNGKYVLFDFRWKNWTTVNLDL